ncbi:MAG: uroporphyrinogen decarboxylase family protein [Acidobacteriota bacterium]
MTDNQPFGLPGNWAQMTPAEKREHRLNQFKNPKHLKFVSPDAEEAYKARANRIADALNVQEPDRLPASLPVGNLPFTLHGIRMHDAIYDVEKGFQACKAFNEKYSEDLDHFAAPFTIPGKALEILDYKLYAWPGHGLSTDAPDYQYVEGEYMKAEEYDALIRDPSDFWLRTYLPRIFGAFEGFRMLSPLPDILEIPTAQLMPLANQKVRESLRRMIHAGEEIQKRNELGARLMEFGPAHGFPSTMGMITVAPFDAIGDTLRGTKAIMIDMFRHADKLLEAIDVMTELIIHSVLDHPNFANMVTVLLPLHKGADGWMSEKQFDTFYWPSLKKVMDAFINEGIIAMPFAEGGYNTRLETITDFPKGSVAWWLDQTDMAKAKKILGSKFCIQGNVPSSLVVTGDPAGVKEHCRKLIEICAPGGGYILAAGCIPDNPKLENIQAMHAAALEYGVYSK